MKKIAIAVAMAGLMGGMAGNAFAGDPDRAVGRVLDSLEYSYEVDEDGVVLASGADALAMAGTAAATLAASEAAAAAGAAAGGSGLAGMAGATGAVGTTGAAGAPAGAGTFTPGTVLLAAGAAAWATCGALAAFFRLLSSLRFFFNSATRSASALAWRDCAVWASVAPAPPALDTVSRSGVGAGAWRSCTWALTAPLALCAPPA